MTGFIMRNQFDKPFEIHSGETFLPDDIADLFGEIVIKHNLQVDKETNGVLVVNAGFGELRFRRFEKQSWLKWIPNGP